jgi:hypothetical protein
MRDEAMLDMAQEIRNRSRGHFLEQAIGRVPTSHQDMVPFDVGLRSRRCLSYRSAREFTAGGGIYTAVGCRCFSTRS